MPRTVYLGSRETHGLVGKMKARKGTASNSRATFFVGHMHTRVHRLRSADPTGSPCLCERHAQRLVAEADGPHVTAEQSERLWQAPGGERLKEKCDRALLAVLLACSLRRHEAVELNFGHIQQREEHWAIVDLEGKAGHIPTIPVPAWVKNVLDQWLQAANTTE